MGGLGTIRDGKIDVNKGSFQAGMIAYRGTFDAHQIGPPPDGSDPLIPALDFAKMAGAPLILRRGGR